MTILVLEYSIFVSSCLCLCFPIFILMILLYISLLGKKVEHKYVNIHTLKIHCMFLVSIEAHSCLRWQCRKVELEPLRKSLSAVTFKLQKPLLVWDRLNENQKWGRFDSSEWKKFCWHRAIFSGPQTPLQWAPSYYYRDFASGCIEKKRYIFPKFSELENQSLDGIEHLAHAPIFKWRSGIYHAECRPPWFLCPSPRSN